jgi:hypothetical protein
MRSGTNVTQVYLNIVLDDALEEKAGGEKVRIGMVVIRGNAVVMLEVQLSQSPSTVQVLTSSGPGPHQPRCAQDRTVKRSLTSTIDVPLACDLIDRLGKQE